MSRKETHVIGSPGDILWPLRTYPGPRDSRQSSYMPDHTQDSKN